MLLQDKIAVVTGASRGIGRATAKALAREGAMVIVNYNGSKERADEVVSEIEKDGGKAKAIQCNVSDFEQAKEFPKKKFYEDYIEVFEHEGTRKR